MTDTQQAIAKNIPAETAYELLARICDTFQISPPNEVNQQNWIIRIDGAVRHARKDSMLLDKAQEFVRAWGAR